MDVTILDQDILVTIIDDDTIRATVLPNDFTGQSAIQFDDEGVALGTIGTVTEVDFTGAGVTGSRSGSKVTYTIPGGGGGGGSGDVVGPSSSVADEVALFSGTTGKLLKSGGGVKDGTGGVVGLTALAINFKNVANTFTSNLTNTNTAARTYTFQDRDGTIADTWVNRIKTSGNDRWHPAGQAITYGSNGTAGLAINSIRLWPHEVQFPQTIDRIAIEITTGTTGKMRIGIWSSDANGMPSVLVLDSGEITVTAPAVYPVTISKLLLPGLYWMGYITDTGNTARAIVSGAYFMPLGWTSTIGTGTPPNVLVVAQSYGPLPNPITALLSSASALNVPLIALRIS